MRPKNKAQTLADIARLAGVSTGTVSRVLSDSPLISTDTKARVRKVARALDYRPNLAARNLRLQRSATIAMVLWIDPETNYSVSDPFLLKMIGAVSAELARHEYDLLLSPSGSADANLGERHWGSGRVDGLIVIGQKPELVSQINRAARNIPLVVWSVTNPGQDYCTVCIDNLAAARQAVEHLISHGRRRIALLGLSQQCSEAGPRTQGYLEALRDAGLPVDPALIVHSDTTIEYGFLGMQQLLSKSPDLDAVFVQSDVMALGALEALRASGRRVPEDVSLAAFDNIDLAAFCSPPLTTVSQRISQGGAALLVEKLMAQLAGEAVSSETLPGKLIVRQSCGEHPPRES
jgi:DNA-binding LacI/PurR family transcriptional regulator